MEVNNGQDLGLQWLFADDSGAFGSTINDADARARTIADALLPEDGSDGDISLGGLAGALARTGGTTMGWGQISDSLTMAVILTALKEQNNANILSTPSLLTLDNQEAYITVGQNVPFVTGSYTNTGAGGDGAQNPFLRVAFSGRCTTHDSRRQLDDGIERVLWLSRADLLARSAQLRSPMVMRAVDDYERGIRYPIDLFQDLAVDQLTLRAAIL